MVTTNRKEQGMEISLLQATALPEDVAVNVNDIAEEALQSAFGVIANRLDDLGFPVTGDISPGEAVQLDSLFSSFVRTMALNNVAIAALNDEKEAS
jgi:hypothetical protein